MTSSIFKICLLGLFFCLTSHAEEMDCYSSKSAALQNEKIRSFVRKYGHESNLFQTWQDKDGNEYSLKRTGDAMTGISNGMSASIEICASKNSDRVYIVGKKMGFQKTASVQYGGPGKIRINGSTFQIKTNAVASTGASSRAPAGIE